MKKAPFLTILYLLFTFFSKAQLTISPPAGTPPFCSATAYQFTGSGLPGTILSIQWKSNPTTGVNIATPNQNSTDITFNTTGTYTLTLIETNSTGTTDSAKYVLTVNQTPTLFVSMPGQVCLGGTGTMLYVAGALTYTWSPTTALIVYANGDSANSNPTSQGTYTYSVIGKQGSCTSVAKTVTVSVTPPPVPIITADFDTICAGNIAMIYVYGMPSNTTYTWTAAPAAGLGSNSGSYSYVTPVFSGSADTTFQYFINVDIYICPAYPTYTVNIVVMPCNGIEENFSDLALKFFPNPALKEIIINSPTENATLELYNCLGEKVFSEKINSKTYTLQLDIPMGIYELRLITDDKKNYCSKLIKE